MLDINQKLRKHLAQEITTIATCWKLSLKSGEILGFTDYENDLIIEDITYYAETAFTASAIENNHDYNKSNFQVQSFIDNDYLSKDKIMAGDFDYAIIDIFLVNYQDTTMGKIHLKRGNIGKIKVVNNKFIAEINTITQCLNASITQTFSPKCRANFADNQCKLNISKYSVKGEVTEIIDSYSFRSEELKDFANHYFNYGTIKFIDGAKKFEVREFKNSIVTLNVNLVSSIKKGDEFVILAGCDKKFSTCISKFDNAINFRGEPHIPTNIELSTFN